MITHFIEATNVKAGGVNHGKFMLGQFADYEWGRPSAVDSNSLSLLYSRGWTPRHLWVMDLQTGEGAFFMAGGSAFHDLQKHSIWVCPLFENFLTWLYTQDLADITKLPTLVEIPDPRGGMAGYRRDGKQSLLDKAISVLKWYAGSLRVETRIDDNGEKAEKLLKEFNIPL